jgi:hypothetical protein
MRSKPSRPNKNEGIHALDEIMDTLFKQAKAHFGAAVKGVWFYDGELCPGCLERPIDVVKFKGQDALSIKAFIYRERGILIGYFLCDTCANFIHKEAQKNPYIQTPLHADIERNLIAAYRKYLAPLNN